MIDDGSLLHAMFRIGQREIGSGRPCYVIAEAGVNHDGDLATALRLVEAAAEAGVDAVKFQTFRAEDLADADAPLVAYQRGKGASAPSSQRELLARLELPTEAFERLREHCERCGVQFLSSPHTESAVDELADLVPAFKVGSGDLTNPLLLRRVAAHGKPTILGTGMATLAEIERAVDWLLDGGCPQVALLHGTTEYPCPLTAVNLAALVSLRSYFDPQPVGLSDHTTGLEVAVLAVALGASLVEKHFTLDRARSGPDHAASLELRELAELVRRVREVPVILGSGEKRPTAGEAEALCAVRKGLVAARNLPAGHPVTIADLKARRPATGIGAERLDEVLGRRLRRAVAAGARLDWELLES